MQLTVKNAARLLNLSKDTIYRWIKEETIPFLKIGENYFINRVELLEWATAAGLRVSTELFAEDKSDKPPMPDLFDAIKAGGIFHDIKGGDQAGVLRSIVGILKLPEDVDRDFLYQVLLARESLGSTGIGNGIAIPHVRNPVVLHISKPSITLCFLEKPIDFKAIDGKPVKILFTIISPTVGTHLHLLSRLGYMLRNPDVQNALERKAPESELLNLISRVETELAANTPNPGQSKIS